MLGWTAVCLNTSAAGLWAFWGAIEGFHEGWWHASLAANVAFTFAYLIPAAIFVALGLIGIQWPRAGALIILAFTTWLWWWWNVPHRLATGSDLLPTLAMSGVGGLFTALWWFGRAQPRRWARRLTLAAPLLVALASAAEPAYRVATRHDDGLRTERTVVGNSVTLTWAPPGPGWPQRRGHSWHDALHAASHLSEDGATMEPEPTNAWRLPTIDELARSMTRGGHNAGGAWDPARAVATFARSPDKETPLWNPDSEIIYWWTADEATPDRAWTMAYNGRALARPKSSAIGTLAYRLVRRTPAPHPGPAEP